MSAPGFWDDQEAAQELIAGLKAAKAITELHYAVIKKNPRAFNEVVPPRTDMPPGSSKDPPGMEALALQASGCR